MVVNGGRGFLRFVRPLWRRRQKNWSRRSPPKKGSPWKIIKGTPPCPACAWTAEFSSQMAEFEKVLDECKSALAQHSNDCDPMWAPLSRLVNASDALFHKSLAQDLDIRNLKELKQDLIDELEVISEIDGFTNRGGMIRLYARNNRIRFDINQGAAREVEIRFDLRLTRLAASVHE